MFLPAGSVALRTGEHLNLIVAWSFILFGVTMTLSGVVRATGAVIPPLVILTLALLVIRFPLAYFFLDEWQAEAIWWSFPISSVIAAALSVAYYRWGAWRTQRMGGGVPATPVPASSE